MNENYSSSLDDKCNLEDVYYDSGTVVSEFTAYCLNSWYTKANNIVIKVNTTKLIEFEN